MERERERMGVCPERAGSVCGAARAGLVAAWPGLGCARGARGGGKREGLMEVVFG